MVIQKIIILGGGITGLISALHLNDLVNGNIVIYELRSKPSIIGGALNIPPNGIKLLDELGALDKLKEIGATIKTLEIFTKNGKKLGDVFHNNIDRYGYDHMRIIRKELYNILFEMCKNKNINIIFGKDVFRIDETFDKVKLFFKDGTDDSSDILLGCDGIHSVTRKLLIDKNRIPIYTGIANTMGFISKNDINNPILFKDFGMFLSQNGSFGSAYCDSKKETLYWFYSYEVNNKNDKDGWKIIRSDLKLIKENLNEKLKNINIDFIKEIIEKTNDITFYPVWKLNETEEKWYSKRSILLGDAAHAMPPHAGQGVSMALEDVFLFKRLLQKYQNNLINSENNIIHIFDQFQQIRKDRISTIFKKSVSNGEIRKDTNIIIGKIKELGIKLYLNYFMKDDINDDDFGYDIQNIEI